MDAKKKKKLYEYYKKAGYKLKVYDYPIVYTAGGKRHLREFDIEELLFRKPLIVSDENTNAYYKDKVVLLTGGGGSIGSELCRQLAKMKPKQIIILDIYENGAYDVQQELKIVYGDKLNLEIEICSITNRKALEKVFKKYRPQIVINAAAHKHVPLMEKNCIEAIYNNIFGTENLVDLCEKYEAERFMMVSTDKAVNPTNVMGATKRFCEMIVQSASTHGKVKYSATRFGNVLGSAGSVIPLFKRQIANGGPVTVTDKRIIRYFMTIPEASQLVLQSGAMAKNGELFVLDMGQPVKILDLAENLIQLSGVQGIKIVETGLRPGEKLYEELLVKTEELDKTPNKMIFIERDTALSKEEISERMEILRKAFVVFNRSEKGQTMNSRLETLLKRFGLKNRIFNDNNVEELRQPIDYQYIDQIIEKEKVRVHDFLDSAMKEISALPKEIEREKKHIQISRSEKCSGCTACSQICPKKCITMQPDGEGFLYPVVDEERCIECGKCKAVCPVLYHDEGTIPQKVLAEKNRNEKIRSTSSSGGVFYELAKQFIQSGGEVYGCALDENMVARHICATSLDELDKLKSSKYVQSHMGNTMEEIKKKLLSGKKILFSGTPCQTAGLHNYLGKEYENLFAVDVLCHGVPSPQLFADYLEYLSKKQGGAKPISVNFRNKERGWKRLYMEVRFDNGKRHYIYSGSYKVSRPFNIAVKKDLNNKVAKDFMSFIMSTEGQKVVADEKYIAVADVKDYAGTKPSGSCVVGGSSSVSPLMEKLIEAYKAVNPNASIELQTSDSTTGMTSTIEGSYDIGMASRELKEEEAAELEPTVIATDGIAVVVNNANPLDELSADQVKDIYVGNVSTWDEITK